MIVRQNVSAGNNQSKNMFFKDIRDLQKNLNKRDAINSLIFYKVFGIGLWYAQKFRRQVCFLCMRFTTAGALYKTPIIDRIIRDAEEVRLQVS